jgi:hypothetical protein
MMLDFDIPVGDSDNTGGSVGVGVGSDVPL